VFILRIVHGKHILLAMCVNDGFEKFEISVLEQFEYTVEC